MARSRTCYRRICIKVNHQKKPSPEYIQSVYYKMHTIGTPQKQGDQIRVRQKGLKYFCTFLEQHPMDRKNKKLNLYQLGTMGREDYGAGKELLMI